MCDHDHTPTKNMLQVVVFAIMIGFRLIMRGFMYDYKKERPAVFTESGVRMLTEMRDRAFSLLQTSGAVRADKIFAGTHGHTWHMMAVLDYMVETGDLRRVTAVDETAGQHQVFVRGRS